MTYGDSMASTRRRDKAATRAALLDAARSRFADHGYDGTGVRDIAQEVGVDPALIFRYFGSKEGLFAAAVQDDVPSTLLGSDLPLTAITDRLVRDLVFADRSAGEAEHPLLVMLRSAGRPGVREQLSERVCDDYLSDFARRIDADDAALRAELVAALILGAGVMRTAIGSPALSAASAEEAQHLIMAAVRALTGEVPERFPGEGTG